MLKTGVPGVPTAGRADASPVALPVFDIPPKANGEPVAACPNVVVVGPALPNPPPAPNPPKLAAGLAAPVPKRVD